jgi:CO/xanthine dehydrogenase Mo-binding subunit
VYTNNPPCGAMRGFGAVQVCFAHEGQMDKLAAALGMDPVQLRLKNALHTGSVLPTGQVIHGSAPAREVIEKCAALPLPPDIPPDDRDPVTLPGGAGNVGRGEHVRRGVGFALGYKNIAYSGGFDDSCEARVRLERGAHGPLVTIHTAAVEVGQGLHTVLAQIARTEIGVDDVVVLQPDTRVGTAGSTSASRQTVMAGGAVATACAAVRERLFGRVVARAAATGVPPQGPLRLAEGRVFAGEMRIGEIADFLDPPLEASEVFRHRPTTPLDEHGQGDPHVMFAFGAQRAVVEVDEDLGMARVVQLAAVQDVGRALNPRGVEGQIEGGSAQGLGLALFEEVRLREGRIQNASFTDYLLPTILDMPPVVSDVVEEPEPNVPFGAKGVGEGATIVATSAIVAALRNATSRELNRVPVTPDDLVGLAPPRASKGPPAVPDVPGPRPVFEYRTKT